MILDTKALSAFLDRMPGAVEIVSEARELAIPVIVAGEFAFGIAQSRHREMYERSLERMLDRCAVLEIGVETARHYAAIGLELKSAGRPIPANDQCIAALSIRSKPAPNCSSEVSAATGKMTNKPKGFRSLRIAGQDGWEWEDGPGSYTRIWCGDKSVFSASLSWPPRLSKPRVALRILDSFRGLLPSTR